MLAFSFLSLALLPSALAATYDVQVGPTGQFIYQPEYVVSISHSLLFSTAENSIGSQTAAYGDQVVFHFNPKNHTVTQSTFASPCTRMSDGFSSGLFVTCPSAIVPYPFNNL